jgi:uncharacterized delta-60 repeat protein
MKQCILIFMLIATFTAIIQAGNSAANDLVVDTEGRILIVGTSDSAKNSVSTQTLNSSDFTLVRYLPTGGLDTTFNAAGVTPGIVQLNIAEQTQNFGGVLQPVNEGLTSVALTDDNRIIAVGFYTIGLNTNVAVLKLTEDGTIDTTFNARQELGTTAGLSIIDVGQFPVPNNVVNGVTLDTAQSVAIDGQGRIVIAGTTDNGTNTSVLVIRLTPNGELDPTFNPDSQAPGILVYSVTQDDIASNIAATAVAVTANDSIIVGGSVNGTYNNNSIVSSNFFILKLTPDGIVDTDFNAGGTPPGIVQQTFQSVFSQAFALALDSQENIVIAGSSQQFFGGNASTTGGALTFFALARYTPVGELDTTFNADGLSLGLPGTVLTSISQNSDTINGIAISSDDAILATGFSNNVLNKVFATARYTPLGGLDVTFNPTGSLPGVVLTQIDPVPVFNQTPNADNAGKAVALGSNDQLYVAGYSFDGLQTNVTVLNYLSTGLLNGTVFNPQSILSAIPGVVVTPIGQSVTIQGNGVPIVVTNDVSSVAPQILSRLQNPFELIEPTITTDTRNVLKDKHITLSGYASPNALITLYVNGYEVANSTARRTGEWYATLPPLLDGTYEVSVHAQDPLSGVYLSSTPISIKTRTYTPKLPIVTKPRIQQKITTSTVDTEGTADPQAVIEIYVDGQMRVQTKVAQNGTWRARITNLTDGNHTIAAQVKPPEGYEARKTEPVTFLVDQSGEEKPRILLPTQGFVLQGSTIKVQGSAAPRSMIQLFAQNKLISDVSVDKEGRWSYEITNAEGAYELYASSKKRGYTSEKVSGRTIVSPPKRNVLLDAIHGATSPLGTIKIYQGKGYLGMTKADTQGHWSFTPQGTSWAPSEPVKIALYDAQGVQQATIEKIAS